MSSRPSRISQPSAKLNDPSNEADLPLKSHRDFVEKARAAELEKAHGSTVSAPPPQPRSPRAASVEDDHDDEFYFITIFYSVMFQALMTLRLNLSATRLLVVRRRMKLLLMPMTFRGTNWWWKMIRMTRICDEAEIVQPK